MSNNWYNIRFVYKSNTKRREVFIHICCSVDSHYFLQRLRQDFPDEKLTAFFYDPNIHPFSEYKLRLMDVEYSCKRLGIELIEGEYDINSWLEAVSGLENEPEKGERCRVCFDRRLDVSAKKALELGHGSFTTTLLMSPKKSQERLDEIGSKLAKEYSLEWIYKDYRAKNGMHDQAKEVKQNALYRQDYCGCIYGLTAQRQQQEKFMDEMISNIGRRIEPESIESRIDLYKMRNKFEEDGIGYRVIKQRFLNYRLLYAKVKIKKEAIPSYFLCYSTLQNKKASIKAEFVMDNIYYFNRNEVKAIELDYFNELLQSGYKSVRELMFDPPAFEDELKIRQKILKNSFDLSALMVLENIDTEKRYDIELDHKIYEDVKEEIVRN